MKLLYRRWLKSNETQGDFERTKFRLIVTFLIICISTSLFYWIIAPFIAFNVPRVIFIMLAFALFTQGFFFLTGKISIHVAGQLLIGSCWLAFVFGTYHSGGISSIVLPWLALMPVMASLIIDYRNSVVWFVISFATVMGFSVSQSSIPSLEFTSGPWRHMLSIVGLCFTLFFFTSLFDRFRYKILSVLQKRNSELMETKQKILLQNEKIKFQLEHIHTINQQLESKVNEIESRNKTMEYHWNALLDLSKNKTISFGTINESFRHILKVTAQSLGINRVSIWQYHRHPSKIECLLVYDNQQEVFLKENDLVEEINAPYFETIRTEKILAVDDVMNHADTAGFVKTYLTPNNIRSMMDAPYFIDGKLMGVLCCESQHDLHHWSCEDIIFATSMADIISMAYRCSRRNEYERNIREMNKKISSQNQELLLKSEEIDKLNRSLEEKVLTRTAELTERNKQLTEYAFINSHSLRGPLARIIGLIDLMQNDASKISHEDFVSMLKYSTGELDNVVGKITQAIDQGSHFSRKNLA